LQDIARPQWQTYFVSLIRCAAGSLDEDNLISAFKAIRDQVAQWLGLNDADERIVFQYAQRPAKVANDRTNAKTKWKTWARVRIAPVKEDLAELESGARLRAPRAQPQELDDARNARFVQKPGAIPDYAGGTPLAVVELAPREDTTTKSRIRLRLMKNTQSRGIGFGVQYVHACVFWTDARGQAWRSQGMGLRQEELRDMAAVLVAMADRLGVPARAGAGVIFSGDRSGRGTDAPSDDLGITERPFPHPNSPPNKKPRSNKHPKSHAQKPSRAQLLGLTPEQYEIYMNIPPPGPKVVHQENDVNATAEDADDEKDG